MSNKANYYRVGLFVTLAAVLFVIGMIALGIMNHFKPKFEVMTLVENTVQGLDIGSKVKFRGVTVGKVTDIIISPDGGGEIYIYMEFIPKTISLKQTKLYREMLKHENHEKAFRKLIEEGVKAGTRCQLNYEGISGGLYVEINRYDPKQYPLKDIQLLPDSPPYIPSIPIVSIGTIFDRIDDSLKKISHVDFEKISRLLEDSLESANKIMKDNNITQAINEIKQLSENLREISGSFKGSFDKEKVEALSKRINNIISNIEENTQKFNTFISDADSVMKKSEIPRISDDFRNSLRVLNETLFSAKTLMDYLEKHPESFIRGKNGERVVSPGNPEK